MTNPIKLTRSYGIDDATMIQFSRTTKEHLESNLADFSAFDADFDAAFITNYVGLLDNAEGYTSDNQLIDVQVQATLDLEDKMKECRNFYQAMKYFIEKAFPGKKGTWAEFGFNDYEKSRDRAASFIQFYHDLFEVATKYAAELDAAGFDAAKVAQIETLTNELRVLKTTQELSKGNRNTATNERVILLNAAWEYTKRICAAGKIVYADNYGKHSLFILPTTNSGSTSTSYNGVIQSMEILNIPIPNLTPDTVLTITNTGPEPLAFSGAQNMDEMGANFTVVAPSDSQSVTFESISGPGPASFLNVAHNVAPPGSPAGSYEVSVPD